MIIMTTDEHSKVKSKFKNAFKNIKEEHLEIGDFIVDNYIIERKEINDLYTSAISGRLHTQLMTIKNFINKHPIYKGILLIEGLYLNKPLKKYKYITTIEQIMSFVIEEYGVIPIRTETVQKSIEFLKELNNIKKKKPSLINDARGFKRKKTLKDQKIFFLTGLPTIGKKRAETILKNYSNIMEYFKSVSKNTKIYKILKE